MFDVITIGTATIDAFLKSRNFKVLKDKYFTAQAGFPEHEAQCFALGSKLEIEDFFVSTGGGATNSATTFSKQGLKTAAVCKVGRDEHSKIIENELEKEKIEPILIRDESKQTAYSTILISESGERTILVYRGASQTLSFEDLPSSKLKAKWAYINPGSIDFSALEKIINFLYESKIKIALNPSRPELELGLGKIGGVLNKCDILILNREEGSFLTSKPFEKEKDIFKVLDGAVNGIAVMTEGPKGVMVSDGKTIYRAGIFPDQKVVDRTGAGDSFGSGFVTAFIKGGSIKEAIRLGSANATSVVESFGAKKGILSKEDYEGNKRWLRLEIMENKV